MSQPVGFQYKSRIPTLSDDATIVEALKVYHYGVDNYSTEPIPDDSIEGNFRRINTRMTAAESQLSGLSGSYVELVSQSSTPNILTAQTVTTVPITIRSISSQTSPLQQWQNSSSVNIASMSTGGFLALSGYSSIGSATFSNTTGIDIALSNLSHKGIVVKAQTGQTANIQEWLVGGSIVSKVDATGKLFSTNIQVATLTGTEVITNKTLTSPTITGGTISNATSITLSGDQDIDQFRSRNVNVSTSTPSGGNNGDLWLTYE